MANPVVTSLATKHGKTPAQILGRWCVQQQIVFIPKSEKRHRMEENAAIFDFELSEEEMTTLGGLTTPEALETSIYLPPNPF